LHVERLNPDQPSEAIAAPRKLDFGLFESFDDRAGEVRTEHLRGLPLHLPGRILDSRLRFDPAEAAQDRRTCARQRSADQHRHGFRLPLSTRVRPRSRHAAITARLTNTHQTPQAVVKWR